MTSVDTAVLHRELAALALRPGESSPDAALAGWDGSRPLLLGHRGDRDHFPENTVLAVVSAIQRGADGAEFDVRLSKDGVPVVIHDVTVDRTLHGSGRVRDLDAAALASLEARLTPGMEEGMPASVPTLSELLAAVPDGSVMNVELKGPDEPGLEGRVLDALRPHRERLRLIAASFHWEQLIEIHRLDPTLPLGVLLEPGEAPPPAPSIAALPFRPAAVHLPAELVDDEVVRLARAAGMRVHVWNVRSMDVVPRLVSIGADLLMVDDVPAGVNAMGACG